LALCALNLRSKALETHPHPNKHLPRPKLLLQRKKQNLSRPLHQNPLLHPHPYRLQLPLLHVPQAPKRSQALLFVSEPVKRTSASTMSQAPVPPAA
jgi:hypothetical protein